MRKNTVLRTAGNNNSGSTENAGLGCMLGAGGLAAGWWGKGSRGRAWMGGVRHRYSGYGWRVDEHTWV